MKHHQRILEGSALVLALYTSFILGFAEGSVFPYVFTLPVAAWVLLASRRWPRLLLKPLPANVLGVLAFVLAGAEMFSGNIEARLLAGAHLMLYLTWVLLGQEKRLTQYWWLFALCTLMAGIGAVLLNSALYGAFLLGFLFLALWNLALFSLHRAQLRVVETSVEPADLREPSPGPPFGVLTPPSTAVGAIQTDSRDRWLTARFVGGICGLTAVSVAIALAFFLLVPRRWIGRIAWGSESSTEQGRTLVGFSETVTLGSFGTLLESTERVMEVRVVDENGKPMDVEEYASRLGFSEPLFRGNTLNVYRNGKWSRYNVRYRGRRLHPPFAGKHVRQHFRLKPTGTRVLFAMRPNPLRRLPGATIDVEKSGEDVALLDSDSVIRRGGRGRAIIEYTVYTQTSSRTPRRQNTFAPPWCRQIPDRKLRSQLADFLQRKAKFEPADTLRQRADRIVRLLRDSGEYSYTMTIPPRKHRELDPVIEFLEHRKTGHCEYYATSLALLLRVAGVPSRLVGGFKGGERNQLSGYYEIQQRHAHAWVEAYLNGDWVTLDATPASRDEAVESVVGAFQSWQNFKNFIRDLWTNSMVDITYSSQRRTVYAPLQQSAEDAWNSVSHERHRSASGLQALKTFLSNPSRWFSWQGGVLSFVGMLLLASLIFAVRRSTRFLGGLKRGDRDAVRRRIAVAFYERFRRLCESLGLVREPAQTQGEFAHNVSTDLRNRLNVAAAAADIPVDLVAVFYDVRFGKATLTAGQLHQVDDWLSQLEHAVRRDSGI
ncbi:MAG: DUF3488 and DUF4129 domain-containing transglutaminase family protein [Planctomycetaceae bacterium]